MFKNFIKGLGYALLMLVFPIIPSVIIQVSNITDDTSALLLQTAFFALASGVGLLLMHMKKYRLHTPHRINKKAVLWFLPLIVIELIPLINGFDTTLTLPYILVLLAFTIFVGISEEVFFRGLVLQTFKEKGTNYAIIASSILFGVLHLSNLAGGVSTQYAIFQVAFAFLFGFVASLLAVSTQSLLPVIIWHFTHDFVAFITGDAMIITNTSLVILAVQCVILVGFAIYLWIEIKKNGIQKMQ